MLTTALMIGATLLGQPLPENPIQQSLKNGFKVGETKVTLPSAMLADGASGDDERAALRKIAGSDREAAELTRDSVTAPVIVRTRDERVGDRGVIRMADLWFVVHARLNEIDPEKFAGPTEEGQTVEAANMRFSVHQQDKPREHAGEREWSIRVSGRLLDRIQVEATNQILAYQGKGSWVIAMRTDPGTDDKARESRWFPIKKSGDRDEPGKAEPYQGGLGYVKISELSTVAGALLVEAHFAFFEPKAWFDGAPVLRSKIGVVAQDRVRSLRRELAKSRKTGERRSSSGPKGG